MWPCLVLNRTEISCFSGYLGRFLQKLELQGSDLHLLVLQWVDDDTRMLVTVGKRKPDGRDLFMSIAVVSLGGFG